MQFSADIVAETAYIGDHLRKLTRGHRKLPRVKSRYISFFVLVVSAVLLSGCQREKRELRPAPTRLAVFGNAAMESSIFPGGTQPTEEVTTPYAGNAYAISEGQRLFSWYNCTGCHANGGGAIGPPLIKDEWIYGSEPQNLFDTIVKGRPNGMPSWGTRIPEFQIWQLVAYVRSLNNLEPKAATPARPDTVEQNPRSVPRPSVGAVQ